MGIFWSRPIYQQPVVMTQPGIIGVPQTTVVYGSTVQPYGYGYGYDPLLATAEVALVADIATDIAIDEAIMDNNYYGGGKNKKTTKTKKILTKQKKKIQKHKI
jgi:hypothetical protein